MSEQWKSIKIYGYFNNVEWNPHQRKGTNRQSDNILPLPSKSIVDNNNLKQ